MFTKTDRRGKRKKKLKKKDAQLTRCSGAAARKADRPRTKKLIAAVFVCVTMSCRERWLRSIDEKESRRRRVGGEDLVQPNSAGTPAGSQFSSSRSGMERDVILPRQVPSSQTFGRSSPQSRTPDGVRAIYVIHLLGELRDPECNYDKFVRSESLGESLHVGLDLDLCPSTGPLNA